MPLLLIVLNSAAASAPIKAGVNRDPDKHEVLFMPKWPVQLAKRAPLAMSSGAAPAAGPPLAEVAGSVEEDAMVSGPSWFWLKGVLAPEEQLQLFSFLHERDATDWEKLSPCMNPTPKTLALVQGDGPRVLSFGPKDKVAVVEMVQKAREAEVRICGGHLYPNRKK